MEKNMVFRVRIDEKTLVAARAKTELMDISFSAYIRNLIKSDLGIKVDFNSNGTAVGKRVEPDIITKKMKDNIKEVADREKALLKRWGQ